MEDFLLSLLRVFNEMSPYLLLGFLVAGILHVFVPKRFYAGALSQNNFRSVLYAALLGIPLPLCSCGVIPTAVGLRNERASRGAVASFLIATPQTGIDSILATASLMGVGFAIVRPAAALVTGLCGGLLVNRLVKSTPEEDENASCAMSQAEEKGFGQRLLAIFKYAYVNMLQDIGPRLLLGLLLAALIQVAVPDSFFLQFGSNPLLQMLVMLIVAVPMYVCSTGSIPIAAALLAKGLTPGAALVLLMAGPAVNLGSILVVRKTMGSRFTLVYICTIIAGAVGFGFLLNGFDGLLHFSEAASGHCCSTGAMPVRGGSFVFKTICSATLALLLINALSMKLFAKFRHHDHTNATAVYTVEGMHCNHCKAAVETAVGNIKGVNSAQVDLAQKTVSVEGDFNDDDVRKAVEKAGFEFVGRQ